MKRAGFLFFFSCWLTWAGDLSAQQWTFYTTANGLAGNSIWSIREDERGYLWFITRFEGASRYDGSRFQNLDALHGLASDNIYSILADKRGNLWFATDRGVSKYDGERVQNLGMAEGLGSNSVAGIAEDREGNLWFATDRGVYRYDGKGVQSCEIAGSRDEAIHCIFAAQNNGLWLGTAGGVFLYDGRKFREVASLPAYLIFEDRAKTLWLGTERGVYRLTEATTALEGPLVTARASSILEDRAGNLWLATSGGLVKYDGENFTVQEGWVDGAVLSMLEDRRGQLWFGAEQGVSRYNGTQLHKISAANGDTLNFVRTIWEDRDGNLWFGTEEGTYKYTVETIRHFTAADGLAGEAVKFALEDREGNLWFGTEKGLSKYAGEEFQHLPLPESRSGDRVLSMLQDRSGDMWVGTTAGLYRNFRPLDAIPTAVRAIVEAEAGPLWFATAEGVAYYDGAAFHNFPIENGTEIALDREGNLWVGSWDAGLYRCAKGGSPVHYTVEDGLASNNITWIAATREGPLWFGFKGGLSQEVPRGGICHYDGTHFKNFTAEDGLLSEAVSVALEDAEGNMWFGSDKGVMRYGRGLAGGAPGFSAMTKEHNSISNYIISIAADKAGNLWFGTDKGVSKYDGENFQNILLEERPNFGSVESILEDREGNLWFATSRRGVFRYAPPQREARPRIHLRQIEADNVYRDGFEEVEVPATVPRIAFEYTGISFSTEPEQLRYTYRLAGHDRAWQSSTHERRALYEKLQPGKYQFEVKAIDQNLRYSAPPAMATITVFQPFYLTAQFVVLVAFGGICSVGGALYLIAQLTRQRRLARQFREGLRLQKEAERIQVAKMEALRQLVAGIAHEINNPIGALVGGSDVVNRGIARIRDLLGKTVEADNLARVFAILEDTLRTNKIASARIAKIVANLLRFVQLDEAEWKMAEIHEGIDTVVALLEPELRGRIAIEREYGDIPLVFCSLSGLNQVFMALLRNAVEAIAGRGTIRIKTAARERQIQISISDTGKGIPPENIQRIFDPGFTTKNARVGVGLGLSICHKIVVEEHGGRIEVWSEPGKGTTFTIVLPQHPERAERGT